MSLKNPVTPPGIDPGTVRLVAQLYIILYYIFCYTWGTNNNSTGHWRSDNKPTTSPQPL